MQVKYAVDSATPVNVAYLTRRSAAVARRFSGRPRRPGADCPTATGPST